MLVKGNFSQLEGLAHQIAATVAKVEQEMDTWRTTSGATSADWLDQAGGQFEEISAAWHQVSTAQQAMLQALRGGVDKANAELQQALGQAVSRVGSVTI